VTVCGINSSAVRFKRRRPSWRRRAILRRLLGTCRAKLVVRRHVARLPYEITFPSATTATYRPSLINCITFFPNLAIAALRDLVFGFCSIPTYVLDQMRGDAVVVLFDEANRYEINLPKPAAQPPAKKSINRKSAPDRGAIDGVTSHNQQDRTE
jgi:hypothetical protein